MDAGSSSAGGSGSWPNAESVDGFSRSPPDGTRAPFFAEPKMSHPSRYRVIKAPIPDDSATTSWSARAVALPWLIEQLVLLRDEASHLSRDAGGWRLSLPDAPKLRAVASEGPSAGIGRGRLAGPVLATDANNIYSAAAAETSRGVSFVADDLAESGTR